MTTTRILLALALVAFAGTAGAGKEGTAGATATGTGGVISNDAMDQAFAGTLNGPDLYQKLISMPATILLEDGTIISPDTLLADGKVINIRMTPDGKVQDVKVVKPEKGSAASGGGSCNA
jgi:hypothetical protein